MEREKKHRLGQLVALIGFLMVPMGGIVYAFFELESLAGAGSAVLGFLIFIAGAELAFSTKPDSSGEDS